MLKNSISELTVFIKRQKVPELPIISGKILHTLLSHEAKGEKNGMKWHK